MARKLVVVLAVATSFIAAGFLVATLQHDEGPARGFDGAITLVLSLVAAGLWIVYIALSGRARSDVEREHWHSRGWGDGWEP